MAEPRETTEETGAPGGHAGVLPQMKVDTFPGQIFWLVVTFGLLFLVLKRKTLPMIEGAIGQRRGRIEGDLGAAEKFRKDAQSALAAYEAALAQARARAHQLADENRKGVVGEIDRLRAAADAEAQKAFGAAETRIAAERGKALAGVRTAAAEAAAQIVERLIGVGVSTEDAAKAVPPIEAKGG
jgi:F-type H+-transporting ATPase subunit b